MLGPSPNDGYKVQPKLGDYIKTLSVNLKRTLLRHMADYYVVLFIFIL